MPSFGKAQDSKEALEAKKGDVVVAGTKVAPHKAMEEESSGAGAGVKDTALEGSSGTDIPQGAKPKRPTAVGKQITAGVPRNRVMPVKQPVSAKKQETKPKERKGCKIKCSKNYRQIVSEKAKKAAKGAASMAKGVVMEYVNDNLPEPMSKIMNEIVSEQEQKLLNSKEDPQGAQADKGKKRKCGIKCSKTYRQVIEDKAKRAAKFAARKAQEAALDYVSDKLPPSAAQLLNDKLKDKGFLKPESTDGAEANAEQKTDPPKDKDRKVRVKRKKKRKKVVRPAEPVEENTVNKGVDIEGTANNTARAETEKTGKSSRTHKRSSVVNVKRTRERSNPSLKSQHVNHSHGSKKTSEQGNRDKPEDNSEIAPPITRDKPQENTASVNSVTKEGTKENTKLIHPLTKETTKENTKSIHPVSEESAQESTVFMHPVTKDEAHEATGHIQTPVTIPAIGSLGSQKSMQSVQTRSLPYKVSRREVKETATSQSTLKTLDNGTTLSHSEQHATDFFGDAESVQSEIDEINTESNAKQPPQNSPIPSSQDNNKDRLLQKDDTLASDNDTEQFLDKEDKSKPENSDQTPQDHLPVKVSQRTDSSGHKEEGSTGSQLPDSHQPELNNSQPNLAKPISARAKPQPPMAGLRENRRVHIVNTGGSQTVHVDKKGAESKPQELHNESVTTKSMVSDNKPDEPTARISNNKKITTIYHDTNNKGYEEPRTKDGISEPGSTKATSHELDNKNSCDVKNTCMVYSANEVTRPSSSVSVRSYTSSGSAGKESKQDASDSGVEILSDKQSVFSGDDTRVVDIEDDEASSVYTYEDGSSVYSEDESDKDDKSVASADDKKKEKPGPKVEFKLPGMNGGGDGKGGKVTAIMDTVSKCTSVGGIAKTMAPKLANGVLGNAKMKKAWATTTGRCQCCQRCSSHCETGVKILITLVSIGVVVYDVAMAWTAFVGFYTYDGSSPLTIVFGIVCSIASILMAFEVRNTVMTCLMNTVKVKRLQELQEHSKARKKIIREERWVEVVSLLELVLADFPIIIILALTINYASCELYIATFRKGVMGKLALYAVCISALWKGIVAFIQFCLSKPFKKDEDGKRFYLWTLFRFLRPLVSMALLFFALYVLLTINGVYINLTGRDEAREDCNIE